MEKSPLKPKVASIEEPVNAESSVIWNKELDGFILKFKIAGSWHFQWLNWSCRGAKQKYFKAMVNLYRHVHGNGFSSKSLRELAR